METQRITVTVGFLGILFNYTFSDFRDDLLGLEQIVELHILCKENGLEFRVHLGG